METDLKLVEKELAVLKTSQARRYLKHVLSPLEHAIILHKFRPFKYKLDDVFIFISGEASKKVSQDIIHKLQFVNHLVEKERQSIQIPFKLRKIFDDPRIILSLQPRLRNRLCHLECYTMFRIMIMGRQYFLSHKGFGKKSMQLLDGLFEKHKSKSLFE